MAAPNDDIDEGFLCDRGRWDHEAVNSPERLRTPLIRRNGELQPASWDEALLVASAARRSTTHGAEAIGGIGSTHTTNEEAYLFQKLLRAGLGTNNVDHFHGRFPATGAERPALGLDRFHRRAGESVAHRPAWDGHLPSPAYRRSAHPPRDSQGRARLSS